MLFPEIYSKPELTGIVEAAGKGWNAVCESGGGPSSSTNICRVGNAPGSTPLCIATGSSPSKTGDVYYTTGSSERLFNVEDMSNGL